VTQTDISADQISSISHSPAPTSTFNDDRPPNVPTSSATVVISSSPGRPSPLLSPSPLPLPPASLSTSALVEMTNGSGNNSTHNQHEKLSQALRPSALSTASAPAGTIPQLIQDVSQYTGSYRPSQIVSQPSTTLAELAHFVRLQSYQEQKQSEARVRLHRCLVSSALSARLERCGALAQKSLVDYFKLEDFAGFANLYNSLHDVRDSCNATRRYALLEPDLDFNNKTTHGERRTQVFSTFWNEVPSRSRNELLKFVSRIRTNPEFLASRLVKMTPAELDTLIRCHQSAAPTETSATFHKRASARLTSETGAGQKKVDPVQSLVSFHRHDPLSALIHSIFANSTVPDSAEDLRRTQVWATALAKIFTESKGSEKLVHTVLDAWSAMREWPGKANLELCLMKILQDGAFLLERHEDGIRTKGNTKNEIASEEFYNGAVKRLFEVLDDSPGAGGIPEGALELGHAILRKIEDPKRRRFAEAFIVYKWLFGKFLMDAVVYPEVRL
jgi:hypothetical protein